MTQNASKNAANTSAANTNAAYTEAITHFRTAEMSDDERTNVHQAVVAAAAKTTFFVPMVSVGSNQVLSVEGPGGRKIQPVFTTVEKLLDWNAQAVPNQAPMQPIAQACNSAGVEWIVINPTDPKEFVLRRSAVEALAEGREWMPPHCDPEVGEAFRVSVEKHPIVNHIHLFLGDPDAKGVGNELTVQVIMTPGTDADKMQEALTALAAEWQATPVITHRAESIGIELAVEGHTH